MTSLVRRESSSENLAAGGSAHVVRNVCPSPSHCLSFRPYDRPTGRQTPTEATERTEERLLDRTAAEAVVLEPAAAEND